MKRSKQERELTDEERNVVISVRHCARELDDILQGARRKAQSNAKLFAESGITVLFRGIDSYADMYEKLAVKSRESLERLFGKFSECEDIQDTQDAIEETEGNWRNFLVNLDKEVMREENEKSETELSKSEAKHDYLYLPSIPLIDCQTNKEISLQDYILPFTCLFVTCQPAYWPDTGIRWRHSEIEKVKCDLSQFNVGYVVLTWGPEVVVRAWSKQVVRATKWPVLWDKSGEFRAQLAFKSGLQCIWAAENLDFLGCQRAQHNRFINLLPTDLNWIHCRQIGGELILTRPVKWNPKIVNSSYYNQNSMAKKSRQNNVNALSDDDPDEENQSTIKQLEQESQSDLEALNRNKTKICKIYCGSYLSDLMPSGSIYQAALTCFARLNNKTETEIMDRIRQDRRFSTAPESARLQYETTTGLYYDPETSLYYDSTRGYFYDSLTQIYYYWSQSEHRYIPANTLIQAELTAAQIAQSRAASLAASRAVAEREAAKQAGLCVAAQLAELRASRDDYAAYAYATCVLSQQSYTDISHNNSNSNSNNHSIPNKFQKIDYQNTTAAARNIETSLKAWSNSTHSSSTTTAGNPYETLNLKPLVPYTDDGGDTDHYKSRSSITPPPPGL